MLLSRFAGWILLIAILFLVLLRVLQISPDEQSALDEYKSVWVQLEDYSRELPYPNVRYSYFGYTSNDWAVVSFHKISERWLIRRVSESGGVESILWAGSEDCPSVENVLLDLEDIELPWIDVQGIGRSPEKFIVVGDGVLHRIAVNGMYEPYTSELQVSSNAHTPINAWVRKTEKALANCWISGRPD